MDVSVIVVSYNTRELLKECLLSIYRETKDVEFEVYVVDNCSADGSADAVEREFPDVKLIRNDQNVGFAAANNVVLRRGKGRYFLLLNPDTQLINNAIKELVDYMDQSPDVGAAGSMILDDDKNVHMVCRKFSRISHEIGELAPVINRFSWKFTSRNYLPDEFDYKELGETDYVQGACLMVRRKILDEVGLLDERYFMYGEEEDWCYRIKQNGWKVMYVPSAVIIHYWGMSTRQRSTEMLMELYKSKLKFFKKNYGQLRSQLLRLTLVALMGFRVPYYTLLPFLVRGKKENARMFREQSCTIMKTMFSPL